MNKIDPNNGRSSFFPRSKTKNNSIKSNALQQSPIQRNLPARKSEIDTKTGMHAKVEIPNAVKDYARIKKAVDMAPEVDNSEKIARLKEQIKAGSYNVNYEKLADKILESEF